MDKRGTVSSATADKVDKREEKMYVRLTEEEKDLIVEAAKVVSEGASTFMRRVTLTEARKILGTKV